MSFGSNAGMETSTPRVDAIVNNALFHSNSHINHTSNHSHLALLHGRLAAPVFSVS